MDLKELVKKNRSYRRFDEAHKVESSTLRELVELTRYAPSASNIQPLRFLLSNTQDRNDSIFATLAWAGYLTDWRGPEPGERPSAYIVILLDLELRKQPSADTGIAAQTIMLGATEKGLGGCMLGAIRKDDLRAALSIPERYEILLVLALGKPAEAVVIEDVRDSNDIKYYRDEQDVHHVPKRTLEELIVDFR